MRRKNSQTPWLQPAIEVASHPLCVHGGWNVRLERLKEAGSHTGSIEPLSVKAGRFPEAGNRGRGDRTSPSHFTRFDNLSLPPAYASLGVGGSAAEYPADLLLSIFDLLPTGLVVIDDQLRVELINKFGESILNRGDTLRLVEGKRVQAADLGDRKRFAVFLGTIFQTYRSSGREAAPKHLFAHNGRPVLSVTACPFPVASSNSSQGKRVLLSLEVSNTGRKLTVEHLHALYGLTPAEARLAGALAIGKTLIECSIDRSVSINTTKTQLNAILAKTGLHRQVDLVRLLVAI